MLKPAITTENVNSLGIRELISEGTSLFYHSIENRIFNLSLAASRLNGILIAPGEVFSFNKALGDISSFTGYKQAYVIENGRTVLGDGGGVCQVSTTLFRAALRAGLPITERHTHAYRVGYYEEDAGPGIDAAIYSPTVDLRFKNDTDGHILIQSYADSVNMRLTFQLYGTKDGREVVINEPVILSQSPAPEPIYQDDPTLPKGEIKQVDFAAAGANVYFTRNVKKDGKIIIADKFVSNYRPWQAVFMRGTKE
jgi:vancomycin resistance protein YoaR